MTLDELVALYETHRDCKKLSPKAHAMRVVVAALRDEMSPMALVGMTYESMDRRNWFNEILGSDAVEAAGGLGVGHHNRTPVETAAGGPTSNDGPGGVEQAVPALTPAADVCEWTIDRDPDWNGNYETECNNGWVSMHGKPDDDGYNFCPSCGKPISFKETP